MNILEHCACAISACSQEDQYPQSACGKISFADGWGSQKSMTMMFLLAALDIKRHHQNESETKEVIFPLERTLSTVQRITFQLPTNFIRPLLGSAKN